MRTNHAKTLFAAVAMAIGLSGLAHADRGAAPSSSSLRLAAAHGGVRDTYTDGARVSNRDGYTDGARVSNRDGYTDGARTGKADPFTDGMAMDRADPYGNGAHNGTRDPYTEGGGRTTTAGGDCLYRQA